MIESCDTCRFYSHLKTACRKSPPSVLFIPVANQMQVMGAYPPVTPSDWCGSFEVKVDKES